MGLAATPAPAAPRFTACPSGHTRSCAVSTLRAGQSLELRAVMAVPTSATRGEHVKLTAEATAITPKLAVSASATATVAGPAGSSPAKPSAHHPAAASAAKAPTASAGKPRAASVTRGLSPGSLPLVAPMPPLIAGPVTRPGGNLRSLLPLVPPARSGPVAAAGGDIRAGLPLPAPRTPGSAAPVPARADVAPTASATPLNRGLLGTQMLALAALCAAIGIVFVTFAMRKPRLAYCAGQPAGTAPTATSSSSASAATPVGQAASDDAIAGPPKDFPSRPPAAESPGTAGESALPATQTATAAAGTATAAQKDLAVNYTGEFIRLGVDIAIAATALLILYRLAARRSRHLARHETTLTRLRQLHSGAAMPSRRGWTLFGSADPARTHG